MTLAIKQSQNTGIKILNDLIKEMELNITIVDEPAPAPKPQYTVEHYKRWFFELCKLYEFQFDKDNIEIMKNLFFYFYGKQEETKYDVNKGIYLFSDNGVGKSFSMNILSIFTKRYHLSSYFQMVKMYKVIQESLNDVVKTIKKYTVNSKENGYGVEEENPVNLCYDDSGIEEKEYNKFGNKVDVMTMILDQRYDLFTERRIITHMTSNISFEQLPERYPVRIQDRMIQMFNFDKYPGKSRRK